MRFLDRMIPTIAAFAATLTLNSTALAYDAEDFALSSDTDYMDGTADGGDFGGGGSTGFGAWITSTPPGVAPSAVLAAPSTPSGILDNSTSSTTFGWPAGGGAAGASRTHAVGVVAGTKFGCRLEYVSGVATLDTASFGLGATTYVTADPLTSPTWIIDGTPSGVSVAEPIWVLVTDTTGGGSPTIDVAISSLVSPSTGSKTSISGTPPSSFEFGYAPDGDGAFLFNNLIIDVTGALPTELDSFEVE